MSRIRVMLDFDPRHVIDVVISQNDNITPLANRLAGVAIGDPGGLHSAALAENYDIIVTAIDGKTVKIPETREEAEAMILVAEAWIKAQKPNGEGPDGGRQIDLEAWLKNQNSEQKQSGE